MGIILTCCSFNNQRSSDNQEPSSFYPLIITHVEAIFIGHKYKTIGYSKAIPPRAIKIIDGYIYQINLTIQVNEPANWDKPFFINILHADGTSDIVEFNMETETLLHDNLYDFVFDLETEEPEEINLTLGYIDEKGNEIFDFDNPFKSKNVQLD
jgi:hypothetical protein